MIAKKLTTLTEPLDFDLQLVADELDTSGNNLVYLNKSLFTDAISFDKFQLFLNDIHENGVEIESFNDNTILYEFYNEALIVYTMLSEAYVIFDDILVQHFENMILNYNA